MNEHTNVAPEIRDVTADVLRDCLKESNRLLVEAERRLADAEKDVRRYRYLRQIDRSIEWENLLLCKWGTITGADQIDTAIDAALDKEKGK